MIQGKVVIDVVGNKRTILLRLALEIMLYFITDSQMTVDDEAGTVMWPNGANSDPDLLYMWDKLVATFPIKLFEQAVKRFV